MSESKTEFKANSKAKKFHVSIDKTFITLSLILLVLIAVAVGFFITTKSPSDVAATIQLNGERTFVSNTEVDQLVTSFAEQGVAITREEIVKQLAQVELLMLHAKQKGITVDPAYVSQLTNQQVELFNQQLGAETLAEELAKQGKTQAEFAESVRITIERDLIIRALFAADVVANIEITSEQIAEYYQQNPSLFVVPDSVTVKHILVCYADAVACEQTRSQSEAQTLANQIAASVTLNNFAQFATQYSDDAASAAVGGDLGTIYPGQTVPAFENAAFGLSVGEVSQPVLSDYGYHIIAVSGKSASQVLELSQVQDQIRQQLILASASQLQQAYVAGLVNAAKITYK